MYNYGTSILIDRLEDVLAALTRIPRRSAGIDAPQDFSQTEKGLDRLDAICMTLVAVGEAFRQIDNKTDGHLLADYPEVNWRGVIGVRNVIAHGYFDIDVEQVFSICKEDIPILIETVQRILADLRSNADS